MMADTGLPKILMFLPIIAGKITGMDTTKAQKRRPIPRQTIDVYVDAQEDPDTGGSVGWVEFNCNKCGQTVEFNE